MLFLQCMYNVDVTYLFVVVAQTQFPHMTMYVSSFFILSKSSVCVYSSVSHLCPPVPLLEHLCSALLYPDETLKASVLYVWLKLFGTAGGSAAQSLPIAIRDRVCILLLQTLANASSPQLISNCVGEKLN